MKRLSFFALVLLVVASLQAATAKYNGQTVQVDNTYTRTQCGTTNKSVVKEVSGLACSRVTPGYLWANIDEGNTTLYALAPDGSLKTKLTLAGMNNRDDWEDICTGTYNGVNYIFLGAFGDNYSAWNDQYYIVCIPEPTLDAAAASMTSAQVTLIKFGFPDAQCHNVETLMYDQLTETFYIVDKVEGAACSIYRLPMSLTYGSALQRLPAGQKLGSDADGWDFITAGDISPDGSLVAIKNKEVILLWNRQGTEDILTTVARQPKQIGTYQKEEQGESLAWLDNNTFYTTSDSKSNTPIYAYSKPGAIIPGPGGNTGDSTVIVQPKDTNSIAIVDYQANIGVFSYFGTASNSTSPDKYNSDSTKPGKAIKFANSFQSTNSETQQVTFNYVMVTPEQGGFLVGDSVVIAGYFNNSSNDKKSAVAFYPAAVVGAIAYYTTPQFVNGRLDAGDPRPDHFILTEASDELYFGRAGNTSTFVYNIQVFRKKDVMPTALQPAQEAVRVEKFVRNGRVIIRRGEREYTILGQ